ncbi:putative cytochrome P450 family protein [Lyophyllum shimeji]|uniref:Cytochrome P450 family protein n=1 Tax=Lyophyllum shimeji TaxID=47721 RepID=A0A9P3PPG2_LYOSH|nr:putative cytochrome P450 family protein [Lyophyllum shimeji]
MLALLLQCITLYVVSWTLWRILRRLIIKTDLDNLPGPPPASFLKGNFGKVFNPDAWAFHKELAEHYGRVVRIDGFLGDKQVYLFDPKAVYHVVVKDQDVYEESASFLEANRLFFGEGLLATLGEQHRKQRKMLAPAFSIAHLRNMTPIFFDVAHKLRAGIAAKVASGPREIDMLRWMSRTALELIGRSGLGRSFDTLADDSDTHPYSVSVKQLIPTAFHFFFIRVYLLPTLVKIGTPKLRRFVVDMVAESFWTRLRKLRDIIDVVHDTSVEIFEEKKRALEAGDAAVTSDVEEGKDIISIMMKANMQASPEDRLPDKEVLGQMSTLTFAAMDTTSVALSRTLHMLATHPKVQEKLRQEILSARREGSDLSYDEVSTLPFLDAVCRETLRMYPPFPNILRTTRETVSMPLTTPIKGNDGREMHEVVIPKNTNIIISVLNCNRDPALWGPDSHEWKPERWLKPLPQVLTDAHIPGIYSHLMTFLGGGRACIGFKFSQLEMKVVLSVLLSNFRFSLSEKEILWQMTGIQTPTVKGQPMFPQLLLQVSLV